MFIPVSCQVLVLVLVLVDSGSIAFASALSMFQRNIKLRPLGDLHLLHLLLAAQHKVAWLKALTNSKTYTTYTSIPYLSPGHKK